jgi:hypothetical protein
MREPVPRQGMTVIPFSIRTLPPTARRSGPPSSLTDDVARIILIALANGSYRGPAAEYAGVGEETLSRWMNKSGEPYETFQRWVREAEAYAEMRMVNAITSKANDKPEYALQFLERKFPERWGRAVAQNPGVNVNLNLSTLLQQIELRAASARDPRPELPGRRTILDVINESRSTTNGDAESSG